jgi:hypothetical protein
VPSGLGSGFKKLLKADDISSFAAFSSGRRMRRMIFDLRGNIQLHSQRNENNSQEPPCQTMPPTFVSLQLYPSIPSTISIRYNTSQKLGFCMSLFFLAVQLGYNRLHIPHHRWSASYVQSLYAFARGSVSTLDTILSPVVHPTPHSDAYTQSLRSPCCLGSVG